MTVSKLNHTCRARMDIIQCLPAGRGAVATANRKGSKFEMEKICKKTFFDYFFYKIYKNAPKYLCMYLTGEYNNFDSRTKFFKTKINQLRSCSLDTISIECQ